MGLDMYLYRNTSPEAIDQGYEKLFEIEDRHDDWTRYDELAKELAGKVAQWRKANQIHAWFVANVQQGNDDCGTYKVTREQLIELKDLCKSILNNPEQAETMLPTQAGFFFGSTEYDEYYKRDLEYTVEALELALQESTLDPYDYQKSFFYSSSW